jgi:branched-chain amino acid transport system permease protein
MLLLQLLIDGIQLGALYALMAVGFAIIFGSTRVFHYAHGATYIIVG